MSVYNFASVCVLSVAIVVRLLGDRALVKEHDIPFPVHNSVMVLQEVLLLTSLGALGEALDLLKRIGFGGDGGEAGVPATPGTSVAVATALNNVTSIIRQRT